MSTKTADPIGVEYFAAHASIALDDMRDTDEGWDVAGLAALRDEATSLINRIDIISGVVTEIAGGAR